MDALIFDRTVAVMVQWQWWWWGDGVGRKRYLLFIFTDINDNYVYSDFCLLADITNEIIIIVVFPKGADGLGFTLFFSMCASGLVESYLWCMAWRTSL